MPWRSSLFTPAQVSENAVQDPLEGHVMLTADPFSLSCGVRHIYTTTEFSTCPLTVILDDGMKGGGPQSTEIRKSALKLTVMRRSPLNLG